MLVLCIHRVPNTFAHLVQFASGNNPLEVRLAENIVGCLLVYLDQQKWNDLRASFDSFVEHSGCNNCLMLLLQFNVIVVHFFVV